MYVGDEHVMVDACIHNHWWLVLDDGGSVVANSHCVELVSGCYRILDDGGSVSWVIPDFGTTCM